MSVPVIGTILFAACAAYDGFGIQGMRVVPMITVPWPLDTNNGYLEPMRECEDDSESDSNASG
jgi:hypothetical protein